MIRKEKLSICNGRETENIDFSTQKYKIMNFSSPGTKNTDFLGSGDRKYSFLVTRRQNLSMNSGRESENIDF